MSYDPRTDFLALLRQATDGIQFERMPGLDFTIAAMARAGLFSLSVGQTAPIVNQSTTAWLQPALPSWTAEGVLWLWDANVGSYALATPALFSQLLQVLTASYAFQAVSIAADVVKNATTLLAVQRVTPVATALTLPAIVNRSGKALHIVDWSLAVAGHVVTLTTPDGATIMRQSSWSVYSTPDQLGGITLYPSIDLNGWVIAP
jgi:hypothetical protein